MMRETKSEAMHHEPQDDILLGDSAGSTIFDGVSTVSEMLAGMGSPKGHHRDYHDDDDPHPPPVPRRDKNDVRPSGTVPSLRRHAEEQLEVETKRQDQTITATPTATASSMTRDHNAVQPFRMSAYFVHVPHQGGAGSSQGAISSLTLDCPLEDVPLREVLDLEEAKPSKHLEKQSDYVDLTTTRSDSISDNPLPSSSSEKETSKNDNGGWSRFLLQVNGKAKVSRRFVAISLLCMVLILVSLVVYGIVDSKNGEKNVKIEDGLGSPPFSNSVAPTDQAKGNAGDIPETPPSSSPLQSSMSPFPTESPISDLESWIRERILDLLPNAVQALMDKTSPQSQALDWLIDDFTAYPIVSRSKILQRWTMAIIYYGMNGDAWTFSDGWLTSADICDWFSTSTNPTTCDDQGLLQRLELQNNNLLGDIPDEIQLLSESLLVLDLSQNRLEGAVPESLGGLTNVSLVQLGSNDLTGSIPSTMCDRQVEALVTLFVDCSEVACSCCEGCR